MIARIFQSSPNQEAALQRLGAATVLQWSNLPAVVQAAIVQQALALSDEQFDLHEEIERLTKTGSAGKPKQRS
jgi:hypothetical protein